jgi:hypothetical protein
LVVCSVFIITKKRKATIFAQTNQPTNQPTNQNATGFPFYIIKDRFYSRSTSFNHKIKTYPRMHHSCASFAAGDKKKQTTGRKNVNKRNCSSYDLHNTRTQKQLRIVGSVLLLTVKIVTRLKHESSLFSACINIALLKTPRENGYSTVKKREVYTHFA